MIKCDNQSSINLAKNPIFHARTKHVDAQFYFDSEKLQSNEIVLMYCNTCENTADIFTKPLGKIKFEQFREMLGLEVNTFSIKGETWK
jgi:KUP system potassium uptake protein